MKNKADVMASRVAAGWLPVEGDANRLECPGCGKRYVWNRFAQQTMHRAECQEWTRPTPQPVTDLAILKAVIDDCVTRCQAILGMTVEQKWRHASLVAVELTAAMRDAIQDRNPDLMATIAHIEKDLS
jgi:hypothetical protein